MNSPCKSFTSVYVDSTPSGLCVNYRNTMATTVDELPPHAYREKDTTDTPVITSEASEAPEPLSLLDDEHARAIMLALTEGPHRGRELAETCDSSRPTVYRRLNRLEEAGLVTTETILDPDGHHCKEFHLVRDQLTVTIEDGTMLVTAEQSGA